jgi:Ca-activated chloride channel homolog
MRLLILAIAACLTTAHAAPRLRPELAVIVIVDNSSLMRGPRLELAKDAVRAIKSNASKDHLLGVIVAGLAPRTVVELTPARGASLTAFERMRSPISGVTQIALAKSLERAAAMLRHSSAKHRLVIVISASTDSSKLETAFDDLHAGRSTVSAIGLAGADRDLLIQIANANGGRIYSLEDEAVLPRIVTKEVEEMLRD